MDDIKAFLEKLGAAKLFVLLGTAVISLALLGYLIMQSAQEDMALLFGDLEPADAGQIIERLESMGIPVDARSDGTLIYVPRSKVARIRMDLAQAGIPESGSLGYELFDKGDFLGTSNAVMDINHTRALEGELSKSIRAIKGVSAARVHLVMPKQEIFAKDRTPPSASIILRMNRGRLAQAQVLGIQHLVAAAVPNLSAESITIVDDKGSLLARQSDGSGFDMSNNQEMRSAFENKMGRTIESLLEKTLGMGKAQVQVSADMDFDRTTINAEEFNPDGQVVRATTTTGEEASSKEQGSEGAVTVQNALPDGNQGGDAAAGTTSQNQNKRNEEKTQFEISKTIKTQVKESGTVKRLSVAVLVDGIYDKDGKYTDRPQKDMDQLKTLIKTAMGFDEERGDVLEVVNMAFAPIPLPEEPTMVESVLSEFSLAHLVNVAIPGIIALLILLLFVKPYVMGILEQMRTKEDDQRKEEDTNMTLVSEEPLMIEDQNALSPEEEKKMASAQEIKNMVTQHPQETVSIIRNWMAEPVGERS